MLLYCGGNWLFRRMKLFDGFANRYPLPIPDFIFIIKGDHELKLGSNLLTITNIKRPFKIANFSRYNLSKDMGKQ